jgi:predicted RNase H-like HicB family nuclease
MIVVPVVHLDCRHRDGPPISLSHWDKLQAEKIEMERQFTAIIEKRGKWYVASVEEVPGVNTQGRTLAEARRNLKEALQLVLVANRELAVRERSGDAKRELLTIQV